MDKNAIQKYAIWARNELIAQVKQRAFQYGISDKCYGEENASVINGRVLTSDEKRQRQDFVHEIQKNGFEQAVEEVAYTWFNRFVALRFMEVNDYLPTHVRVFSDASGGFNPEILKDVLHLNLEGLDKAKVSELLNTNQTEELYRYLLLTQCNALNAALPEMFEKLGSYTEMLLPNNILKQDSILGRLIKDIDEDDWKDAVQIIGWLYQYYNTEPKQAVFDGLKKNMKITKEKIPAATQLFTPDWIVRYMVENSLGRVWLEHCRAESGLTDEYMNASYYDWRYYIEEAEQTPEVAARLEALRFEYKDLKPEDIKIIDPCMGSGHILVYAFDVLMKIYTSQGYSERDAAKLILEKNLYGLDIDRRAYQLAYFSLMMKARQYNRRVLIESAKPQVYHPAGFPDGEEYGSLVKVESLPPKPEEPKELTLFTEKYETVLNAWNFKRLLTQKYDVVVTNPPYMGSGSMSVKLNEFVKKNYPDSKSDMSTVFMEKTIFMCKATGFISMINIPVWMFLPSYERLRYNILNSNTYINMIHPGRGIFGSDFGTTTFVIGKTHISDYRGKYYRLFNKQGEVESVEVREQQFLSGKGTYIAQQDVFSRFPGKPIAYWITPKALKAYKQGHLMSVVGQSTKGIITGDNDRYMRLWWELQIERVNFVAVSDDDAALSGMKWFPCTKGGNFRKWYGNKEYIMNWENRGHRILNDAKNEKRHSQDYYNHLKFQQGISWSVLTASTRSFRIENYNLIEHVGMAIFPHNADQIMQMLGFLNSVVSAYYLTFLSPTVAVNAGEIGRLPFISPLMKIGQVDDRVKDCIQLSENDWDAFETSWEFKYHPLLCGKRTVAAAFAKWECEAAERFGMLKSNEEELNRIFIDIYGLQDELTPDVEDKDVTVRRADLGREIRSLISYAVGCMFGRYSLDREGLAYAGGEWDASKYSTFIPDKDNILPICDDEYFEDDIVGRFVDFIRAAYGAETLEENLKFIADALGSKGTPREVIRSYFLNDFYADHCRIYQKRPIYWLFDSGKKNGFKALVYLHRYSRDLLAKMRTDYVHEQQERYRTQLSHIAAALNTATGAERAKLLKQQDKLTEQLKEITVFEEKVHHLADQNITIDLDDGVKKNYEIFADVLAKI